MKLYKAPRETKDDGFKTILGNHELFVQFLSDFVKIDIFKGITPDDIADMTERFIMMGIDSKNGDTVTISPMSPLFYGANLTRAQIKQPPLLGGFLIADRLSHKFFNGIFVP